MPCRSQTVPCHIPLLSSPQDGHRKGLSCLGLFLPLHPPPKRCFPLYCSGCLFREAPQDHMLHGVCLGLPSPQPGAASPHHCLLPLVLAMSRLAWCPGHSLHGGMTQQEKFPKQGCVESLTACGLGHISLLGALLVLFLLKQERQLLSPVCLIDTAAGLTPVSSCVHGVSCGHASPAAPKAAVDFSSPQTSEPCHL